MPLARCSPAAGAHSDCQRALGVRRSAALPFSPATVASETARRLSGHRVRTRRQRRHRLAPSAADSGSIVFVNEEDRYYYKDIDVSDNLVGSESTPADYFQLLNVDIEAPYEDIKQAYRSLQRVVHPDLVGPSATGMAVLLNQAASTLLDDAARQVYAESAMAFRSMTGGGFTGIPESKWLGSEVERRAIFVDETTCIGCGHCPGCAPSTFALEEEHGRARVHQQWADSEDDIREAIDLCPVDCIYYVERSKLALLEWVMKACEREDIAIMARRRSGNMGAPPASGNPFTRAEDYAKSQAVIQDGARLRMQQDLELAGAIARAFLAIPRETRVKAWPTWTSD